MSMPDPAGDRSRLQRVREVRQSSGYKTTTLLLSSLLIGIIILGAIYVAVRGNDDSAAPPPVFPQGTGQPSAQPAPRQRPSYLPTLSAFPPPTSTVGESKHPATRSGKYSPRPPNPPPQPPSPTPTRRWRPRKGCCGNASTAPLWGSPPQTGLPVSTAPVFHPGSPTPHKARCWPSGKSFNGRPGVLVNKPKR